MDPLTQGLLGAAAAQVVSKKESLRTASIAGCLGGMAADLDVLIRSDTDHLLAIEYHRHFTHSLLFIPIGGLICTIALFFLFKRHTTFGKLYLWTTLGYATHGLLDACTSYGTSLYLPFSTTRISWSMMSIIDPIFTSVLLLAVVGAFASKNLRIAYLSTAFVFAYFGFGVTQRNLAIQVQTQLAAQRSHSTSRAIVKPTIGNLLLWRSIYEANDYYYVDAIRVSPFSPPLIYSGDSIKKLDPTRDLTWLNPNSTTKKDIIRFNHFSQGFLAYSKDNPELIIDARYGILPNNTDPLWGISINPQDQTAHTPFITFRRSLTDARYKFLSMVKGDPIPN